MEEYEYANRPVLAAGESVLWSGKPKRSAYIADQVLTMLPIAVIWLIFDMSFISMGSFGANLFFLAFFALHLMPVWLWLGSALTANKRWHNTHYYVTNRRILIRGGFLAVNEESLYYKDIRSVRVSVGLIDKLFGSGDILFDTAVPVYYGRNKRQHIPKFEDLQDPHAVYERVQRIVLDMQTDMEFPNAYRPESNPGYRTEYDPQ